MRSLSLLAIYCQLHEILHCIHQMDIGPDDTDPEVIHVLARLLTDLGQVLDEIEASATQNVQVVATDEDEQGCNHITKKGSSSAAYIQMRATQPNKQIRQSQQPQSLRLPQLRRRRTWPRTPQGENGRYHLLDDLGDSPSGEENSLVSSTSIFSPVRDLVSNHTPSTSSQTPTASAPRHSPRLAVSVQWHRAYQSLRRFDSIVTGEHCTPIKVAADLLNHCTHPFRPSPGRRTQLDLFLPETHRGRVPAKSSSRHTTPFAERPK
ncbi:hypothetical protein PG984_013874 [Apiospora sp. TS-2023a]